MGEPNEDRKIYPHDCDECHEPIKDGKVVCSVCADEGAIDSVELAFHIGCVVGAAIVAWGDAIRKTYPCECGDHAWIDTIGGPDICERWCGAERPAAW